MQNQQLSEPKKLTGLSRNRPHDRQDQLRNVFLMTFLQDGRSLDPTTEPAFCEKRILTLACFSSKKKLIERILVW